MPIFLANVNIFTIVRHVKTTPQGYVNQNYVNSLL